MLSHGAIQSSPCEHVKSHQLRHSLHAVRCACVTSFAHLLVSARHRRYDAYRLTVTLSVAADAAGTRGAGAATLVSGATFQLSSESRAYAWVSE
jgi:hypothetical protein